MASSSRFNMRIAAVATRGSVVQPTLVALGYIMSQQTRLLVYKTSCPTICAHGGSHVPRVVAGCWITDCPTSLIPVVHPQRAVLGRYYSARGPRVFLRSLLYMPCAARNGEISPKLGKGPPCVKVEE